MLYNLSFLYYTRQRRKEKIFTHKSSLNPRQVIKTSNRSVQVDRSSRHQTGQYMGTGHQDIRKVGTFRQVIKTSDRSVQVIKRSNPQDV